MACKPISQRATDEQIVAAYNDVARYPTLELVAASLRIQFRHLQKRLQQIRETRSDLNLLDRRAIYMASRKPDAQPFGRTQRWLLTAAQDETAIDEPFWQNLHAYAADIGAEVLIGGFTYNKSLFEDHDSRSGVFAEAVRPYLIHDNRMLGPLLFAAKVNILPTAVKPLSGLESYSRGNWAVFPHAKVQLVSVPSLPGTHPAMVMTTGCCTLPNYIQKKAGLKAEFHHMIGAIIVELDGAGRLFCRQIAAAADGSFQDLDAVVRAGEVTRGHRIEAISWGDIHREQIDPTVAMTCWGFDVDSESIVTSDTILHTLRPRHQFFHDLLDFRARNHHRRGDHVHAIGMHVADAERIDDELSLSARFLRATTADWCQSVVVASNHNDALLRWLRETDPRADPLNLETWCELNLEWHRRIKAGVGDFDLVRWALSRHDPQRLEDIIFVPRNGSYLICQDRGGIECGMHGDEGPNGARGSMQNLDKVAVRMNIGHGHSAGILNGVFMAGLCGLLNQGYNTGTSSWTHTQIVTYANSRRTLVTVIDGRWRG